MLRRVLAPVVLGGLLLMAVATPAFSAGMDRGRMHSPVMMNRGTGFMGHQGSGHVRSSFNRFRDRDDFVRFRHHRNIFFVSYPYSYYPYYPSYCSYPAYPGAYGQSYPYYPPYPAYCPYPYYPYGYGGPYSYGGGGY